MERRAVYPDEAAGVRRPGYHPRRIASTDGPEIVADQPSFLPAACDGARRVAGSNDALVVADQTAGARERPVDRGTDGLLLLTRRPLGHHRRRTAATGDDSLAGPDQSAHPFLAEDRAHGLAGNDRSLTDTRQPPDVFLAGDIDACQLQVANDGGTTKRAEQSCIVLAVHEQVRHGVAVAVQRPMECPDHSPEVRSGHADGDPARAIVPVRVARVDHTAAVAVEIETRVEFVSQAAFETASHPGERGGECRTMLIGPGAAVAVRVVAHGVELLQRADLDQPVPVAVVVVTDRHRETPGRARIRSVGIGRGDRDDRVTRALRRERDHGPGGHDSRNAGHGRACRKRQRIAFRVPERTADSHGLGRPADFEFQVGQYPRGDRRLIGGADGHRDRRAAHELAPVDHRRHPVGVAAVERHPGARVAVGARRKRVRHGLYRGADVPIHGVADARRRGPRIRRRYGPAQVNSLLPVGG